MDQDSPSRSTVRSISEHVPDEPSIREIEAMRGDADLEDDEFFEEVEHRCCEHVERDNRALWAWFWFLLFVLFMTSMITGHQFITFK